MKGKRKQVGEFKVGDEVRLTVVPALGRYRITGFPSRRMAIVEAIDKVDKDSDRPVSCRVTLRELKKA